MIFKLPKDIKFSYFYRKLNILSSIFIILSIIILIFKGLNLGVDFKGGTLIELRTENSNINISEIRQSFLKKNLARKMII
jgi:preprotein translocase subunit SecF